MDANIRALVERVVGLERNRLEDFERLLQVRFDKVDPASDREFYEARVSSGVFTAADLRFRRESAWAFLVLDEPAVEVFQSQIDCDAFGPMINYNINPEIPPEGTVAPYYTVRGVQIAIQFTYSTRRLRLISFEWLVPEVR